jgi:hypothetical protein
VCDGWMIVRGNMVLRNLCVVRGIRVGVLRVRVRVMRALRNAW